MSAAGVNTNAYYYTVQASASGYFNGGSNATVNANETTNLNFYLVSIGYGGVEGTAINALTGLPVPGVSVDVGNDYGGNHRIQRGVFHWSDNAQHGQHPHL